LAKSRLKDKQSATTVFLLSTLALGILFVVLQFVGFGQIVSNGYYFTGSESSITTTFFVYCNNCALNAPCWWIDFIVNYNL
jgi:heme/copper-type cytochrome/quinol oxidase subunit 3